MVLGEDMLTVERKPEFIVPSHMYGSHTDFSGHEFFEASSIRKRGEKYYFVYSSVVMHELCYAISDDPLGPFCYGGVVVSNCDIGISDDAEIGFKYFECKDLSAVKITVRGYADGEFLVLNEWDGEPLGSIPVEFTNVWEDYTAEVKIPDGTQAVYFKYKGSGTADLLSFELI